MNFLKHLKGALVNMTKTQVLTSRKRTNTSILGKRKLDYTYSGFISSASRPPLASPKLEENSGVKKDEKEDK
ncbi:MAG: hypothetical protein K2N63_07230 [Lachnospiraceae bacterium]|nr:hypothetical protein [Lachnospiraceae bacterium]